VSAGEFREDLLYRLNTIHLAVPPLRARAADIPRFVAHFSDHFAREYGRPAWRPDAEMLERFVRHSWPGNVRQLAQTIQRLYVFEDRIDAVLDEAFAAPATDQPDASRAAAAAPAPAATKGPPPEDEPAAASLTAEPWATSGAEPTVPVYNLDELRRLAVRQAMAATGGHRGQAAELLGVSLNTMTRLVADHCPESSAKRGRPVAPKPR
jgi:DNA-binding NtrC family response regulator